ncbi:cation transporter [Actinomycetospora rhizophila]|uniref:Cation transporter n=1 Tax=Actinomycetospora rhizophila TaxID=1416876 RepID=A0ABV9Z8H2_9PSEU
MALPAAPDPPLAALAPRIRRASWASLVWLAVEGVVAILAGLSTGSVALLGYGLDSAVQSLGSGVIVWRFTGRRIGSTAAEERAQTIVATSFFLLAPYLVVAALAQLISGTPPDGSWVGVGLAVVGIVLMPLFGRAKRRLGILAGSAATAGEGAQHLICAALSATILIGLFLNVAFGIWWADPLAALILAAVAVHTGTRTWRGRGC